MKTQKLLWAILICSIAFVSCKDDPETKTYLITFEDVELDSSGYWDGSDMKGIEKEETEEWGTTTNYYGLFISNYAEFENKYTRT